MNVSNDKYQERLLYMDIEYDVSPSNRSRLHLRDSGISLNRPSINSFGKLNAEYCTLALLLHNS